MRDPLILDDVDRGLVHALHIDGRAPFRRVAEVLGVSTQTVARRYHRLRLGAGLRVVGLPDPGHDGGTQWMLRLTATPAGALPLAGSLARRPDTSWVKLTSGGTEIFAIVHVPDSAHALLLHDIPRRAGITAVSAHCVLHMYLGGPTTWRGTTRVLTEEQCRALTPGPFGDAGEPRPLGEADRSLLEALRHDGRTPVAGLARATGWSEATVARRLGALRAAAAVFFDVDVNPALFGARVQALLWMSVAPERLDEVGTALAGHDELAVVAATTGPANLLAQALCESPADLHRYLTRRVGAIGGIRALETAPVLRTVKAAGSAVAPEVKDLRKTG